MNKGIAVAVLVLFALSAYWTGPPREDRGAVSCYDHGEEKNIVAWKGRNIVNPHFLSCITEWGEHPLNMWRDFDTAEAYWASV